MQQVTIDWQGEPLHLINLHLKSRIPTTIASQHRDRYSSDYRATQRPGGAR